MTSMAPPEDPGHRSRSIRRIAVIGTGLIGTSIAMAAHRAGCRRSTGWDLDPTRCSRPPPRSGGLTPAPSLEDAVADADLVVVATPIGAVPATVAAALAAASDAIVTDAASVKSRVIGDVRRSAPVERIGPVRAGPPDGRQRAIRPRTRLGLRASTGSSGSSRRCRKRTPAATDAVRVVDRSGSAPGPCVMDPERHDRLVAVVSHLPQVASTTLMGLAADRGGGRAGRPAAGRRRVPRPHAPGRLAPGAVERDPRREPRAGRLGDRSVRRAPGGRSARDRATPTRPASRRRSTRRSRPGSVWRRSRPFVPASRSGRSRSRTSPARSPGSPPSSARASVNIEDLQIVHSPEGGRGTVHLTVARRRPRRRRPACSTGAGYDPIRLA